MQLFPSRLLTSRASLILFRNMVESRSTSPYHVALLAGQYQPAHVLGCVARRCSCLNYYVHDRL